MTVPCTTCARWAVMEPRDGAADDVPDAVPEDVPDDGADGVAEDWTGTSAGCWLMAPFFRAKGWSGASERAVGEGSLPLGRADTERFIA